MCARVMIGAYVRRIAKLNVGAGFLRNPDFRIFFFSHCWTRASSRSLRDEAASGVIQVAREDALPKPHSTLSELVLDQLGIISRVHKAKAKLSCKGSCASMCRNPSHLLGVKFRGRPGIGLAFRAFQPPCR